MLHVPWTPCVNIAITIDRILVQLNGKKVAGIVRGAHQDDAFIRVVVRGLVSDPLELMGVHPLAIVPLDTVLLLVSASTGQETGLGVTPPLLFVVVKLRSRSGEGQMRVRKVKETKDLDLSYTLFLVFTLHPPPPETFFLTFKGSRQVRWT